MGFRSPRRSFSTSRKTQSIAFFACCCFFYSVFHIGPGFSRHKSARLSPSSLPVYDDPASINFENTPISPYRPAYTQFRFDSHTKRSKPVICIITATRNPSQTLSETALSLQHQSLTNFEWIIVDDDTSHADSRAILDTLEKDGRVTIIQNQGKTGSTAAAKNTGLEYALNREDVSTYVTFLDDDDLLELTALEKVVWMLESNQDWSIGGFPFVKFGAERVVEMRGLHNGEDNYVIGNFIPNAAVVRSSAFATSKCRYDDVNFPVDGQYWDMWMCLAEAGFWGRTLPELLYWDRTAASTSKPSRQGNALAGGLAAVQSNIQAKHRSLSVNGTFPTTELRWSDSLETVTWYSPYENALDTSSNAIMFVVPWLNVEVADIAALHMIRLFVEAGYRVTVVATLFKNPEGTQLRPQVMELTHDVHILPAFLRANDIPRYLKYLIDSRGIKDVVFTSSQLMYELLPALAEKLPKVRFVDYLHNDAHDGWKSSGYHSYSVISQRYLARTLASSVYLKNWAIANGHAADRIGVVKVGLTLGDYTPANDRDREMAKLDLLGIKSNTLVITVMGQLETPSRALLLPEIANHLQHRSGVTDFVIVVIGDGSLATALREHTASLGLESVVRVLGSVDHPQDYLVATDIFLLLSTSGGTSHVVSQAMAMGIPVVTSRVGGLPEQLGELPVVATSSLASLSDRFFGASIASSTPSLLSQLANSSITLPPLAGVLVNHTMIDTTDTALYAKELYLLISDPEARRHYGTIGRGIMEQGSDWRITLKEMFPQLRLAKSAGKNRKSTQLSAVYFAIQNSLREKHMETDFAAFQSSLKLPPRFGLGLELQRTCGETAPGMTVWLDAMVTPVVCAGSNTTLTNLVKSAKLQCGGWCIFDLTTPKFSGWSFTGSCFVDLVDSCKTQWGYRPTVQLAGEEEE